MKSISVPPVGAGLDNVTAAVEFDPPVTEDGVSVNADIAGALTFSAPDFALPLLVSVAVMFATEFVATADVFTWKVAVCAPAAIVVDAAGVA